MKIPLSVKPQTFADFEHQGWEQLSSAYGDSWGHVTSSFAPAILEVLPDVKGQRLIDVATGPGYAAKLAAHYGAIVTGIDFSASMIAVACEAVPEAKFQIADVESLPFEDKEIDFATSNFGLQHFANPLSALREIARVLKVGGVLSTSIWAESSRNAASSILERAVDRFAVRSCTIPNGPSYGFLWDNLQLKQILHEAGFATATTRSDLRIIPWRLRDPDELFRAELAGSVRSGARLRQEDPASQERIRLAMADDIRENYHENGDYIIPMAAYVISARKI